MSDCTQFSKIDKMKIDIKASNYEEACTKKRYTILKNI